MHQLDHISKKLLVAWMRMETLGLHCWQGHEENLRIPARAVCLTRDHSCWLADFPLTTGQVSASRVTYTRISLSPFNRVLSGKAGFFLNVWSPLLKALHGKNININQIILLLIYFFTLIKISAQMIQIFNKIYYVKAGQYFFVSTCFLTSKKTLSLLSNVENLKTLCSSWKQPPNFDILYALKIKRIVIMRISHENTGLGWYS